MRTGAAVANLLRNFGLDPALLSVEKNSMDLPAFIALAKSNGASDLHLEPGLPIALRIRGTLTTTGEPLPARALADLAREVIGQEQWPQFLQRRSHDLSRTLVGVRCRINILQTARGIGFAIRLLASFTPTLDKLNLNPDLKKLVAQPHGLILLSGPTGCGKSSTMAGLIQEINCSDPRHIITIESPIEYTFRPKLSYIRQREVGRDTPSFEQAILDSMREDPDVLMVGEMREPETMRLTLNASETGHLVLTTVHSSTCVEALQRVANAFPSELQHAVRSQLADCLLAVVCQRLRYRSDLKIRLPELEILMPSFAVKNFIRTGDFFKITQAMETGAEQGMWTWQRYQNWIEKKKEWYVPAADDHADPDLVENTPPLAPLPVSSTGSSRPAPAPAPSAPAPTQKPGGRIEIEPVEGGLPELIKKLGEEQ